jgi:hypothetical protein
MERARTLYTSSSDKLSKKIIFGLKKGGYYIVNNFLSNKECDKIKNKLQDMYEELKISKNKVFMK